MLPSFMERAVFDMRPVQAFATGRPVATLT
jgi:hypothetical protein